VREEKQAMNDAIRVVGNIWQPGVGVCAMAYSLSPYDVENMRNATGGITRDDVDEWLAKNAGDFREVLDFEANIDGSVFEFANEDSVGDYHDAMYGVETA
jgi:hypothetical protein